MNKHRLILLFLACTVLAGTSVATDEWHPVRVARDGDGWPHFFEVWDEGEKCYVPTVLCGYEDIALTYPLDKTRGILDGLSANHATFTRLWMGAGDGFSAYRFDPDRGQVDLDEWNDAFFERLDVILSEAARRGIVIEVMLWDRCTSWIGGGLSTPKSWQEGVGHERDQNVFHPDNHYRSGTEDTPVPGVVMRDTRRIEEDAFYNIANAEWMARQQRYMARVMEVLQRYDNVTVELINEAPASKTATVWRRFMHEWLKAQYPSLLVQSESLGADEAFAAWGRDNPGMVDMTASHDFWSYDSAQAFYHTNKGVVPGCNEYIHRDLTDMANCRRLMWGLTMAGGASWLENILPPNGPTLTHEIHAFFHPHNDAPRIGLLRPARDVVAGNDGLWYALAADDNSEVLVYVSEAAGTTPFRLAGFSPTRYRWYDCAGKESAWGEWHPVETNSFEPPMVPCGLQLRADVGIPRSTSP